MTLRVILFDLDETLFDHLHASRAALASLRRSHAALDPVSLAELSEEAYRILERTHLRVLSGELTAAAARVERLRQLFSAFGVRLEEAACQAAAAAYVTVYRSSRQAIAGARALVDALGDEYTIGVVTNNFREEQESKLADCGLTDAIDFMVTSEEAGIPKPSPDIFRAALARGDAQPTEAVMVGDSWAVDVIGARNAGIRPVWFNRHQKPRPQGLDVDELRSFEPLAPALRVIRGHG